LNLIALTALMVFFCGQQTSEDRLSTCINYAMKHTMSSVNTGAKPSGKSALGSVKLTSKTGETTPNKYGRNWPVLSSSPRGLVFMTKTVPDKTRDRQVLQVMADESKLSKVYESGDVSRYFTAETEGLLLIGEENKLVEIDLEKDVRRELYVAPKSGTYPLVEVPKVEVPEVLGEYRIICRIGGLGGKVSLIDTKKGKLIYYLDADYWAISGDKKRMITGNLKEKLKLVDPVNGNVLSEFGEPIEKRISQIVLNQDGSKFAMGLGGDLIIADIEKGLSQTLVGGFMDVPSIEFSSNSKWLAWGTLGRIVWIWDLKKNQVRDVVGVGGNVSGLAFVGNTLFAADASFICWEFSIEG